MKACSTLIQLRYTLFFKRQTQKSQWGRLFEKHVELDKRKKIYICVYFSKMS